MAVAVAAWCGTHYPLGPLRGLTVHSRTGLLPCGSFPHWTVPLYLPFLWRFLPTSLFVYGSFPHFFLSWLFLDGSSLAGLFLFLRFLSLLDCPLPAPLYCKGRLTTSRSACRDGYAATSQSACILETVRELTQYNSCLSPLYDERLRTGRSWAKAAQSTPRPQLMNRNPSLRRYTFRNQRNQSL